MMVTAVVSVSAGYAAQYMNVSAALFAVSTAGYLLILGLTLAQRPMRSDCGGTP